ncbi:hypothetical protein G7Y89_g5310 [Cudoniella acicularis]|uniref:Nitrogen regulatory protein areA GATA-like domain-containing protein n=1 Tax=Cudoniella acicularis TaxID=354080 RepID=A0A8H4RQW1_9HELO|nr:hypothetical protein G7Y89_g5310 [Cudoniella acicularis]
MSLILPKGIVVNSSQVNADIGRIDTEPLDLADIARFWKVYTTTKRRLLDPTAERLENYWWRIWGSRRRELNGATIARLFAQISDGESFVPLRGPANRDEGTPPLERNIRHGQGALSATTLHQPSQSRPSTTSSTVSRPPTAMPPPILKKTRGPSSTGPRPTARFISPHESEKETDPDSSVGSNSHVIVQPPSPEGENTRLERKAAGAGRKKPGFVASSGAKKKRPVIVRRQNSQTSQSSTESGKLTDSGGSVQSPAQKTPPSISASATARLKKSAPSKFQENFSPTFRSPGTPAKTLSTSKVASSSRKSPNRKGQNEGLLESVPTADPGPFRQTRPIYNEPEQTAEVASDEKQVATQSSIQPIQKSSTDTVTQQIQNNRSQVLQKPPPISV